MAGGFLKYNSIIHPSKLIFLQGNIPSCPSSAIFTKLNLLIDSSNLRYATI